MIGKVDYEMTEKKLKSRKFSRSLFISSDVKEGDLLTKENVRSVRPGNGLHPKHYYDVLGKVFLDDFEKGTPLKLENIK